jgi:hypothetical protein
VYVPTVVGAVHRTAAPVAVISAFPATENKTVLAGSAKVAVEAGIVDVEPIVPAEAVKATVVVTAAYNERVLPASMVAV